MNSFFPDAIASWNHFMEIFNYKDVPSIVLIKNDIISLIHPESKAFPKIHDSARLSFSIESKFKSSKMSQVMS